MTRFNKYQYVELLINPGQANPGFTPQQYLQNRQIYSLEVFNASDINESRSNINIATAAMVEGMFLNLYCTDVNLAVQSIPGSTQVTGQGWGLWFRDVPCSALHRVQAGTNPYVRDLFEIGGNLIDFEQSYVNITPTSQALISSPVVLLLGIGYK
jgi:hypothetical protein